MPSAILRDFELKVRFDLIFRQLTDILDDLFFMRLELEAGVIPVFPPEPVFDAMKTLVEYP